MPKRKHYECQEWDCAGVEIDANSTTKPSNCPCGNPVMDGYWLVDDDDDDDFPSPTANNAPRPSWYPGRRKEIKERATTPGGTIYCNICHLPIDVNAAGKEEWRSKSGNKHETSPHVDHYGRTPIDKSVTGGVPNVKGPWIDRRTTLQGSKTHTEKSTPERNEVERAVFNASPLQLAHMTCNCSKGSKN